jgi:hypothetical protein
VTDKIAIADDRFGASLRTAKSLKVIEPGTTHLLKQVNVTKSSWRSRDALLKQPTEMEFLEHRRGIRQEGAGRAEVRRDFLGKSFGGKAECE